MLSYRYLVQLCHITVPYSAENNNKDYCNTICSVVNYFTKTSYDNSDCSV